MNKKLRVQCIFAHPDDAEDCGGTIAKLAAAGHIVQIVSITNGQCGHYDMPVQELVSVRFKEVQESRRRLGIDSTIVLDNKDGYLTSDIATRESVMRAMREFAADIIITHRPYSYHPDIIAAAQLVQDCICQIRLPKFLPLSPITESVPKVFFKQDYVMKPMPISPDIVVDIDDTAETKLRAYEAHATQVYDFDPWWSGHPPPSSDKPEERWQYMQDLFHSGWEEYANRFRDKLIEQYGEERGKKVRFAEIFEAAEFGAPHDLEMERQLFCF